MRDASQRLLRLLCLKPLCQHHHCTVNYLSVFLFLFFVLKKQNLVPTRLTQREGQDFLWHHQVLPPLCANAAHPTEARSHCEARDPLFKNNMQRVSISLPPEHHMVMTVWPVWCFYVFLVSYCTDPQKTFISYSTVCTNSWYKIMNYHHLL